MKIKRELAQLFNGDALGYVEAEPAVDVSEHEFEDFFLF